MKHDMNEVVAVEKVATQAEEQTLELAELQLALVGGGIGEVVLV